MRTTKLKLNDKVLITQKDAPYNFYNKVGSIIETDVAWYLVKVYDNNENEPCESWFFEGYLKLIKG